MTTYRSLYLVFALTLCASPALRAADEAFDFEVLQFRAKNLAGQPYKPPVSHVPTWLQKYTYDQLRDVRFEPMRAWWLREGLPFQVQFFHPGGAYCPKEQTNGQAIRRTLEITGGSGFEAVIWPG